MCARILELYHHALLFPFKVTHGFHWGSLGVLCEGVVVYSIFHYLRFHCEQDVCLHEVINSEIRIHERVICRMFLWIDRLLLEQNLRGGSVWYLNAKGCDDNADAAEAFAD